MFADYNYYTNDYGSNTIPESDFPNYSEKASDRIAAAAFGRLDNGVPEEHEDKVKHCCCELAESLYTYAPIADGSAIAGAGTIASETNGKYSVSYQSGKDQVSVISARLHGGSSGLEDIYSSIIRRHLSRTGLLYRGVE